MPDKDKGMNREIVQDRKNHKMAGIIVLCMAYFLASLSEMLPSGVLNILAGDLEVSPETAGQLIGIYALGAAFSSIPVARFTLSMNRKKLLMIILTGFSLAALIIPLFQNFYAALVARLIGGMCAGAFWPMAPDLALKIAPRERSGNVITIVTLGASVSTALGLPLFTRIGSLLSWQAEFYLYSLAGLLVILLSAHFVPPIEGEVYNRESSFGSALKNRHLQIVLLVTVLIVMAHYGLYTFNNELFVAKEYPYPVDTGLFLFGTGAFLSVLIQIRVIARHLRTYALAILTSGILAQAGLLLSGPATPWISPLLVLWGISFGGFTAMLSNALARRLKSGRSISIAIQSCLFDISILAGTAAAGMVLARMSIDRLILFSLICLMLALLIIFLAGKTFRNAED